MQGCLWQEALKQQSDLADIGLKQHKGCLTPSIPNHKALVAAHASEEATVGLKQYLLIDCH